MRTIDWLQLALFVGLLALVTRPIGLYLVQVLDPGGRTRLDPLLKPVERLLYRLMGVTPEAAQDWRGYSLSLLWFSAASCVFTYTILRFQHSLPLNPEGLGPVSAHLAFNIAVSFMTNTNWQSYAGESTLSHFSQMVGLTLHNFTSGAAGIGVAAAVVRGLARQSGGNLGNFWSDLVRTTLYLLLPASLVFALFLVSQGTVQNLGGYTAATGVERSMPDPGPGAGQPAGGGNQRIVQGPMASQVAIKMLATNGGGFANANAAHPFENPTPLSNFLQMLAIFLIGSGLTFYLGVQVNNARHGWSVWAAMMVLFLAAVVVCAWAESRGNPVHQALGIASGTGNMEGKEVRFGIFNSALFATVTTAASCGAVNAMHDSFTPLGGLVPLVLIQLGEVVIGGVGSGLYGMVVFVVVAVFIAGLMVGRTPEYLGKKLGAFEIKMAMLALIAPCMSTLAFAAWAAVSPWGMAGLNNTGPHGLTEILYAYSSATGNNGSAFAGLTTNTPIYNLTLGVAMLAGRFMVIIPTLALAGGLATKPVSAPGPGTFPVSGGTFVLLLIATIVMVGALNFLPVLALSPVVEHFLATQGRLF